MMDLFKSKVKEHWKSISIDGSAFDSTQYADLQTSVEDRFWLGAQKDILLLLQN